MTHDLNPVHPGEILMEEFLRPLNLSQYRLAAETRVPPRRINEIVKGLRSVTPDTALRLAKFFGTSEMFWLNLQAQYDLDVERGRSGRSLDMVRPLMRTAAAVQGRKGAAAETSALRRRARKVK